MLTQERLDGETPAGGTYSIAYYLNEKNEPCDKSVAKKVNVVEYDKDDNRITESYFTV